MNGVLKPHSVLSLPGYSGALDTAEHSILALSFLRLYDIVNSLFGNYFSGSWERFTFSTCLLNARVSQSPVFRILFLTMYFWGPNTDGHRWIYHSYHDGSQICLWPRLLTELNIQWLSAVVPECGPTETTGLRWSSHGYTYSSWVSKWDTNHVQPNYPWKSLR